MVLLTAGALSFLFTRGGEPGGPDVALAMDFKRGQTLRYMIRATFDGSMSAGPTQQEEPVSAEVSGPFSMTVLKVDRRSVATVRISVGPIRATSEGTTVAQPGAPVTETVRIGPDGSVLSGNVSLFAGGTSGATSLPGMDQVTPLLPDHPVGLGDSWDTHESRAIPGLGTTLTVDAHSSFDRYETIDGIRTAVVHTRLHMPLDIDVDLRSLARMIGTSSDDPGLAQLPDGAKVVYRGSMDMDFTSWLDRIHKQLERMQGTMDFDFSFNVAYQGRTVPDGDFSFKGTAHIDLERIR